MSLKFLSSNYPLHDYYFYIPKHCLKVMGFWPETSETKINIIWSVMNFILLSIGVLTEMHAGLSVITYDLEKGLDTLCPAGTSAVTLLKMFFIFYYRRDLQYVVKKMYSMLYENGKNYSNSQRHQKIIRKYSVLAARFNFAPFVAGFFTCTTYNLKPIILACIFWYKGKEVTWMTPFNMT